MLSLSASFHEVSVSAVTTTRDKYGDTTEATSDSAVSGVLFAPEGVSESVSADSPAVIGEASLYGGFPRLDADDTVTHAATCCDGRDFAFGTWQVVGGSRGWGGPEMVVVPIKRASDA